MNNSAGNYTADERVTITSYLRSLGLEPSLISDTGWDGTGYFEHVVRDGKRHIGADGLIEQSWKSWPEGFDFQYFLSIAWRTGE
jgi:hypothetical protein